MTLGGAWEPAQKHFRCPLPDATPSAARDVPASIAMDTLDCRSPRRCPTCEHWQSGTCALEVMIEEALASRIPLTLVAAPASA